MLYDGEQTAADKIDELKKVLLRPQELKSLSEGSNIVLLVIEPQQESFAIQLIQKKFPQSLLINCSNILLDSVDQYGIQNLRDDFDFSANLYLHDFAHFLFEKLKNTLIEGSRDNHLLFLYRVGLLNEIIRVNSIVESLAGCLPNPFIILYPGQKKDRTLTYLNGRHKMSVYRAYII